VQALQNKSGTFALFERCNEDTVRLRDVPKDRTKRLGKKKSEFGSGALPTVIARSIVTGTVVVVVVVVVVGISQAI
jgi:hypothetical protein